MLVSPRSVVAIARAGDVRARLRAIRDGQAALRVAAVGAALSTGVLEALRVPRSLAELAAVLDHADPALLGAFLRVLSAHRLVDSDAGWLRLTSRGRAILDDDVARAAYEGFAGFHSGVYRELDVQLHGGPGRADVTEHGDVIARLSRALGPLVVGALRREAAESGARRILDVGCGDGTLLAALLEASPAAEAVGIEVDDDVAGAAARTLSAPGVRGRARVVRGDVRVPATLAGVPPVDLVVLANVLYYVPPGERTAFVRAAAGPLAPGGRLAVVTTVAEPSAFSRHFDLLLRAQTGAMSLPTVQEVVDHVEAASLTVRSVDRLAPGDPLHVVTAERPRGRQVG